MAAEDDTSTSQSPTMLRLEIFIAVLLTCGAASLSIFMPDLIASGGI